MDFWKNNWEHFVNFIKFIGERLICIIATLLLISLVTFCFFKLAIVKNPESVDSQQIFIFEISLDNLSIWFTFIGLIVTAFWSMHQYNKSKASKQQEKAAEIAKDFADNLVERMGLITHTLSLNEEVQQIMNKLDKSKLNQFTEIEIKENLKNNNIIESFLKIINSKNTQKRYEELLKIQYNDKEKEKFDSYFPLLVENTLNKLEASCINISSKAAGSQFIYESLHQMFLSTIEILAIKISIANTDNVDKYYTNIISVYNMWNIQKNKDIDKLNKTNEKIKKHQEKIKKHQEKMEKEIKKLLIKQTKTV